MKNSMTELVTDAVTETVTEPMLPSDIRIPPGTCVAIVAPGGYAPDEAAVERGIALLEAQGCKVKSYYDHSARHQRFGATDIGRAAHIQQAAADPEVQIVMALRGAYGVSRILPALNYRALAASGKFFIGYSDITALHLALLAQTGAPGFAGPMLCSDFGTETPSAMTMNSFWRTMTQPTQTIKAVSAGNPTLEASGMLWGGNLAMIVHLLGTPYFPQVDGGILFVEDVNEHPTAASACCCNWNTPACWAARRQSCWVTFPTTGCRTTTTATTSSRCWPMRASICRRRWSPVCRSATSPTASPCRWAVTPICKPTATALR